MEISLRPSFEAATDTIHVSLAEIGTHMQQSVQTLVSFYLLNKILRCVGIIFSVEFSKDILKVLV